MLRWNGVALLCLGKRRARDSALGEQAIQRLLAVYRPDSGILKASQGALEPSCVACGRPTRWSCC